MKTRADPADRAAQRCEPASLLDSGGRMGTPATGPRQLNQAERIARLRQGVPGAGPPAVPVVQRVGLLAAMSTLATYAAWNTMLGTPLGLLAAYLLLRQGYESYAYRTGLTETDENRIEESTCTVHVIRTQKWNHHADSYQDDHISLGVKINGRWAKQVGFWMDRSDYKWFPELAIRNQGEVRNDKNKFDSKKVDRSGEEVIHVAHEQAAAIVKRIEADEARPPKFSATGYGGYTCITWAHDVLSSNGVTMKLHNVILPPYPQDLIPDDKMKDLIPDDKIPDDKMKDLIPDDKMKDL